MQRQRPTTERRRARRPARGTGSYVDELRLLHRDANALEQVLPDAQGIRHNGQPRIDRRARREKAAVHDVEIVDFVRLAIHIEGTRLGIMTEADRAVLVRDARQRDALPEEKVAGKETLVAVVAMM